MSVAIKYSFCSVGTTCEHAILFVTAAWFNPIVFGMLDAFFGYVTPHRRIHCFTHLIKEIIENYMLLFAQFTGR